MARMLLLALVFSGAAISSEEPRLRIEKIDPDGTVTVREIPTKAQLKRIEQRPYSDPSIAVSKRKEYALKFMQAELEGKEAIRNGKPITEHQRYAVWISSIIQQSIPYIPSMSGQECVVEINLLESGELKSQTFDRAPSDFCKLVGQTVMTLYKYPVPTNPELYKKFRYYATIIYAPQQMVGSTGLPDKSITPSQVNRQRGSDVLKSEKQRYLAMIVAKIQQNWLVDDSMRGNECQVNMRLSPTGFLESVTALSGYEPLCNSALKAIKKGSPYPMSPDPEVYDALRSLTPILKPELR